MDLSLLKQRSAPPICRRIGEHEEIVSLAVRLRHCIDTRALRDGRAVHSYIAECAHHRHTFLGNCLIQLYGTCGCVEDAQSSFDNILHPNLFSWNILIHAYGLNGFLEGARAVFHRAPRRTAASWNALISATVQNDCFQDALDLLCQMWLEAVVPDAITFVSTLSACTNLRSLREAHRLHCAIVQLGYEQDVAVGNSLINMYGKFGNVEDGKNVFSRLVTLNIITWTAIISSLAQNGDGSGALHLFQRMQLEGITTNNITFVCLLDACASLGALQWGKKIHMIVLNSTYKHDMLVINALISMYGRCRSTFFAESVFRTMTCHDHVSWNAIITAFLHNNCPDLALNFFWHMEIEGISPDHVTFVCALDACAGLTDDNEGMKLHAMAVMAGHDHQVIVSNSLISMYGDCGRVHEAYSIFDILLDHDIVSWNAMITAFLQNEYCEEALAVYAKLQLKGLEINQITFLSVLNSCTQLVALEKGKEVHDAIHNRGYGQDVVLGAALVEMYGKCGCLLAAKDAFGKIRQQNVVSWTIMIEVLAQNGEGIEALSLLSQMLSIGLKPDSITSVFIINACTNTGLIAEGVQFFLSMRQVLGLAPTFDDYLGMADLFGRAGLLDAAEDIINFIPLEDVFVAWHCLLAACKIHGDLKRGNRAAKHCFELESNCCIPYITLSNIYACIDNLDATSRASNFEEVCAVTTG